jgi:hypothetical protein
VGCHDECANEVRSREDKVARLVADEQRAVDKGSLVIQFNNADTVGEVVDDPASPELRIATATGSRPTGTEARCSSLAGVTRNISSLALGVLTALQIGVGFLGVKRMA